MKGALALRQPSGGGVLDTSTSNVTNAAFVTVIASLAFGCSAIMISNSGTEPISIAKGQAGEELHTGAIIPPESHGIIVPINLGKGERISVVSLGDTQSAGYITLSLLQ